MKKIIGVLLILSFCIQFTFAEYYTDEYKKAYDFSYKNGITTMKTIEDAYMHGPVTRIAVAKMISNYAINVLKLKPDTSKNCIFSDVSDERDKKYDYGVKHICQLGLMGIGDNGKIAKTFNPDGDVLRGQLVTILSRLMNRVNGKTIENGNPYYITHLNYLKSTGVVPSSMFFYWNIYAERGYVMSLIYRSADPKNRQTTNKIVKVNEENGFKILNGNESYYNEYYGIQIDHVGNNKWVVSVGDGGLVIHSFVPEKYGNYQLDGYSKEDFVSVAKSYSVDGYLCFVHAYSLIKKGTTEWNYWLESWKDQGFDAIPTSKGYVIDYEPGMHMQESPYVTNNGIVDDGSIIMEIIGDFSFVDK